MSFFKKGASVMNTKRLLLGLTIVALAWCLPMYVMEHVISGDDGSENVNAPKMSDPVEEDESMQQLRARHQE